MWRVEHTQRDGKTQMSPRGLAEQSVCLWNVWRFVIDSARQESLDCVQIATPSGNSIEIARRYRPV
jgi:hypothetical protein